MTRDTIVTHVQRRKFKDNYCLIDGWTDVTIRPTYKDASLKTLLLDDK